MATNNLQIVEYFGPQEDKHCGYCKSVDPGRFTHAMWAHQMSVEAYQYLLDRGWRRSGKYCYKPTLDKICCPQYTIRCDAVQFHPSRSQKRVIKRLNLFLATGAMPKRSSMPVDVDLPIKKKPGIKNVQKGKRKAMNEVPTAAATSSLPKDESRRQQKAKFRRRQRKLEKLRAKGIVLDSLPAPTKPPTKQIEEFLSFNQTLSVDCVKIVGASRSLEIRLVRSSPPSQEFIETFRRSFELFQNYQRDIHNDPSTENGYRRFLVDSPLLTKDGDAGQSGVHSGYGSFHQQYWLDGTKLIAVGVLDILPSSVSSKYFYYDTDYRSLALGVYSALQEIALVRRLQRLSPDLRYYYMGFYIHSCPKMRYKGRYRPSELLCPESYAWYPILGCQSKLDVQKYSRFDDTGKEDDNGKVDLDNVGVFFSRAVMPYPRYKSLKAGRSGQESDEDEVKEYAQLIGKRAAPKLVLYRSDED